MASNWEHGQTSATVGPILSPHLLVCCWKDCAVHNSMVAPWLSTKMIKRMIMWIGRKKGTRKKTSKNVCWAVMFIHDICVGTYIYTPSTCDVVYWHIMTTSSTYFFGFESNIRHFSHFEIIRALGVGGNLIVGSYLVPGTITVLTPCSRVL